MNYKWLVVRGYDLGNKDVYGPFDTIMLAREWAERKLGPPPVEGLTWNLSRLQPPSELD